jgi:hypothetical protein
VNKHWSEMTLSELHAEKAHWDKVISEATGWGAALSAADEFRRGCERAIKHREAVGEVAEGRRVAPSVPESIPED